MSKRILTPERSLKVQAEVNKYLDTVCNTLGLSPSQAHDYLLQYAAETIAYYQSHDYVRALVEESISDVPILEEN